MSNLPTGQRRGSSTIVILIIFILIIALFAFMFLSPIFERNAPKVIAKNNIYWNLKTPLKINFTDDSGIKFVRIKLSDGKNSIVIFKKQYTDRKKIQIASIEFPRGAFGDTSKFFLDIDVVDYSKWNFLSGNNAHKTISITTDEDKPIVSIVDNSYKIIKGGSAIVIFKAEDKNLKDLYIETNFGKRFYPTPFYKQGYFISLLAWPVNQKRFRANIVATDKANNITKESIRLFYVNKKYMISYIILNNDFIDGKISDLIAETKPDFTNLSKIEKFKYINENLRNINENIIKKYTMATDKNMINGFYQNRFYPLRGSIPVASFGDHRYYKYKGHVVSEAWHLGIDLASIKKAKIETKNRGVVVFADKNGIYGNNIIIYHGLGLYTLYGHSSGFLVKSGDAVKAKQPIAHTGTTGLALGDHLHFGVLIQGIEVRPKEWMDKKWIKTNITNIIKTSKKLIDGK